jgi:hypothetical protein
MRCEKGSPPVSPARLRRGAVQKSVDCRTPGRRKSLVGGIATAQGLATISVNKPLREGDRVAPRFAVDPCNLPPSRVLRSAGEKRPQSGGIDRETAAFQRLAAYSGRTSQSPRNRFWANPGGLRDHLNRF